MNNIDKWKVPELGKKEQNAQKIDIVKEVVTANQIDYDREKVVELTHNLEKKEKQLEDLINNTASCLQKLQDELEKNIANIICKAVSSIVLYEVSENKDSIKSVAKEIISCFSDKKNKVSFYVNQSDKETIEDIFNKDSIDSDIFEVVVDEKVSEGGCIVKSCYSHIDASIEKRIRDVIAVIT